MTTEKDTQQYTNVADSSRQSEMGRIPEDTTENTTKASQEDLAQKESSTSFTEAMAKQATEEENPSSLNFPLAKILGGDMWSAQIIRKQIWLIVLIVVFMFIYISNRYHVQKDLLEIDRLQKELQDAKFKQLSSHSQITEKSRESKVLEMLRSYNDSTLHMATQPPYIINIPENSPAQ